MFSGSFFDTMYPGCLDLACPFPAPFPQPFAQPFAQAWPQFGGHHLAAAMCRLPYDGFNKPPSREFASRCCNHCVPSIGNTSGRKVWRKVRASYAQPPLGAILCFPAWNLAKQRFDQISNGILRTPKVVPHPGSGRKVFWPQLDLRIGPLS